MDNLSYDSQVFGPFLSFHLLLSHEKDGIKNIPPSVFYTHIRTSFRFLYDKDISCPIAQKAYYRKFHVIYETKIKTEGWYRK